MRKIKASQVAAIRQEFADKQGGRCAICQQPKGPEQQVLDHDHTTGFLRDMLCRNCNGLEGKIHNLARRGQGKFDKAWFLKRVMAYWEKHDGNKPEHGLLYYSHKTEDDKRIRTNKLARARRAAAKE